MADVWKENKGTFAPTLELAKGQEFIGTLLATREKKGLKTKFGPKDTTFYDVVSVDGEPFSIIGNGNLDFKLKGLAPETAVKIVYHGKVKATTGPRKGKLLHSYTVYTKEGKSSSSARSK